MLDGAMQRSSANTNDVQLVADALAGRQDAIRAFLERMRCVPRMLTARNRQFGRPLADDELEDVVQDTLTALWKKLPSYDGRAALETWAHQFCYFEFMMRVRRSSQAAVLFEDLPQTLIDPRAEPVSPIDVEQLLKSLDRVDANEAEVLRLRHFDDLTFDEAAERLRISPNTAKSRYYRGLRKLRELIGKTTQHETVRREP